MERNVEIVRDSQELLEGTAKLARRCVDLAAGLITQDQAPIANDRRGRKAHPLEIERAAGKAG